MSQPRRLFAALILIVAITGVAEADGRAIVPVAGSAAGVNGANFRTEMQLHNPGNGVMRGSLMFLPQSLVPQQAGGVAALEYEIGPKETIRFADVIASMGASGLGSLDVLPFEGGRPRIVVRAFDDQGNFGTRGLMVPVLEESEAPVLGFRFVLVGPSDLARYRFNIGVRTLGESSTMLRIVEHDAAGAAVGEPIVLELLGETFRQQPAGMLLGREVVAGHTYAFETLSGAAFVYATTVDNQTNDGALQLDRPVNRPPVVAGATVTTDMNEPVTISISATDPDDDPMTFQITAGPSHGTLSDLPNVKTSAEVDVSVVYTPASDYQGPDMFTVLVSDDVNGRTFAHIVINVGQQTGLPPNAVNDKYTMNEGETLTVNAPGVLANDTDPENNPLIAQLVQGPFSEAKFTFNADGSFVYRPKLGFSGGDFFLYKASDGGAASNVARVTIIVNSTNEPPNAVADAAATTEDVAIAINVLANDSDPEGYPLTIVSVNSAGTLGAVTIGAGGVINYDPTGSAALQALAAGAIQTDTFSYTVRDVEFDTATATVTVTVTGVDDLPTATNDAATLAEDAGATAIDVLANDTDPDGGTKLITIVTQGTNGTVAITGGGTGLTYQPNPDYCGADSFTYTITGGSAATVTVTVTCVNDAPSFSAGANPTVLEDSGAYSAAFATAISAGPSPFEDGQTLTFNVTNNTNLVLFSAGPAIDASGNLTFTPATDANGSADITITLSDSGGVANGGVNTSGAQIFTISVTAVNDEPSFTKGLDETVLEETGAHSVPNWATALSKGPADESGQTLTFTLTNDNNVLFLVQPAIDASGNLTYTLAADASGSTTVTVSLADSGGILNGGDDTAPDQTFAINVTDINDAPSFTGGADESVNEDSGTAGAHTVAGWATAISAGPSPFEDAQTLNFVIDTNDNPGLFSVAPAIDATGTLTYTLAANAFGMATITLHLHDSGGVLNGGVDDSTGDTLVIIVASQNDNPTAVDDAATVVEDSGAAAVVVLANDDDAPDTGETLTIAGVTQGTNGGAVVITGGGTGLTYQPAPNFAGTDTFTYTIGDGNGGSATATVTMTVTAVNDPPLNTVPGVQSVDQLMTLTFSSGNGNAISIFDVDAVTPQVTVAVDNGVVSLSGTAGLSFSNGDGTADATMTFTGVQADLNTALGGLVYDPLDTFEGAATLTVTTNDLGQTGAGGAQQDVDTVTINVTALNDPPVNSLPAAQATPEDTTLVLSTSTSNPISISDPDAGGANVQVTLTATNGTMTLGGTTGLIFTVGTGTADAAMTFTGTISDINTALDGLQFIPTATFSGAASIQVVTDDLGNTGAGGAQSDTDTLTITVNAVNNAPVNTVPGAQTIDEDGTLTFAGTISVADDAGTNPIRITLTVTQGTLSLATTSGLTPVAGADGSASMTFDGTLTDINNALNGLDYNPTANYFGSDTLTLTTNDLGNTGSGGPLSDTDLIGITINSINDAPTDIQLSNSAIDENQASGTAVGNLTTTDADVADTHTYSLVAGMGDTDNASFQIVGGQLQTAAVLDFESKSSYSVLIRTTDSGTGNLTYEEAFTITLNNVNENPTDMALSNASVQENQASGTAVGNFSTTDPDTADTFTYTLVAGTGSADNGSFQIVGDQLQTAAIFDFETKSSYSIRVRSTDAGGLFFEKEFTISITNQNEAPTDMTLTDQSVDENSGVNAEVGTFSTTDPDAGDTFTYTLVAGSGSTDNALFNISGNSLRENASFDFEAQSSYSIRVRTTDAGGLFVEVVLTITIVNVPEAPIAGNDSFDTIGNTLLEVDAASSEPQPKVYFGGNLLANDTDPDTGANVGLTTSLNAASVTAGAVVVVNSDGTFTYVPPAGHALATDTFTYTVTDPTALTAVGTVTINLFERVWYVDPNAGGGGTGTSTSPFNSLDSLDGAAGAGDSDVAGDYIFVYDGALSRATPMEMEANQHLVGEGVGLSIPVNLNASGSPWVGVAAGTAPQITATAGDTVTVNTAIPIEIVGLSLASTLGNSIDLTSSGALTGTDPITLTIGSNEFRSAGAEGIDVNMNAGTIGTLFLSVTNNSWNIAGAHPGNAFDARTLSAAANLRLNFSNNSNVLSTGANAGVFIDGSGGGSLVITGFASNLVHQNSGGTGISINAVRFDADTVAAGYQQVSGGTTVVGTTGNGVGASGVVMTNVSGDLAFTDLDIYADNGSGLVVSGTGIVNTGAGTGTRVTVGAGVGLIEATNGPAVSLTSMTTSLPLASLRSTNSTTNGVALNGIAGTFSAGSGSTISGVTSAAGTSFQVGTSNATITYDGTITSTTGKGVDLTSNTGSTITFTGTLTMSSGATTTFNATGGGTVTASNTASTLTSTTGTALNIANTTIGAAGLKFRSISANGGASGIVLNTTGASGGLTVSGTGTTDGSGGTIQNTSGRGASFISASNISLTNMNFTNAGTTDLDADNSGLSTGDNLATNAAIHLQSVTGATTLDNLNISGGAEQGINGNTVANFTLSNSSIVDVGNGPDEDGIHFFNMSGVSAITNTTINCTVVAPNTTGGDDHFNLQTQSGTLNLTISGGSATNANKGSGYLFGIRGTSNATITFSGANSSNNFSGGIVADVFDNATMELQVLNSTSSGNNDQLSVSAGDSSAVELLASGNTLSSPNVGDFVAVSLLGSAFDTGYVFEAILDNNTITTGNDRTADGIAVFNAGGGAMHVAITNNNIFYRGTQRAILVQAGQDGSGATNMTITGNDIDVQLDGTTNAVAGILAQSAITGPGNTSSLCLDIGGAGALSNTFTHSLGGTLAAGDIRVRQRNDGTVRLPGYGGAATAMPSVVAYLDGRNTVVSASTATSDSSGMAGGAACTQPVIP